MQCLLTRSHAHMPNKLSYESAGLAIGVGVVLFTALITVRGQPGWSSPDGVKPAVADLGQKMGSVVTSDDEFGVNVADIAPFLAGVGIPDAANLAEINVDYGGVNIKGGDKLSAADDGDMLSTEPAVRWMSQDDPFTAGGVLAFFFNLALPSFRFAGRRCLS